MNTQNDKLIRSKDVREMLGNISETTLWRRIKDGSIPTPIKLGNGTANYFKESMISKIVGASTVEK